MSILGVELFKGERALVTGAASNIGRSIAVRLAGEGAEVTITDVDSGRLSQVADEVAKVGMAPRTLVADLSDKVGWRTVWEFVEANPPAIFVHSACPHDMKKILR